jgi:predicted metal-dependent phosphoesterase TrpH
VIDLHLHTTASDGASTPAGLVAEARAAGLSTIAVTDHDTTAAIEDVTHHAGRDLTVVPGIEITAVENGRDVHVLGYFLDSGSEELQAFLRRQRDDRRRRVVTMIELLRDLGVRVEESAVLPVPGTGGDRALGRPMLARAIVEAGHATDIADAFDKYLGAGRPAFVQRFGTGAADVVSLIARAGGLASLAHPGTTRRDDLIPSLVPAGLAAIEVFHPDHDAATTEQYRQLANRQGLEMTGGSDYHGAATPRGRFFGHIGLPAEAYARFVDRLAPARRP